eukprot:gnl/TRDRNA2_/TRDRNA2_73976_c0_seq2.p1 gnl/TRDRNA2_/TRDRNA2_73976_c0~~gnl/TRDRNA2_/TRDRNA2_73976_c0_seq2.p1  ORF type:complete len:108 (+),score=18.73 gnl/TRDRNA2_/TRDRNA2_73976_c0_seq2:1-324(+)
MFFSQDLHLHVSSENPNSEGMSSKLWQDLGLQVMLEPSTQKGHSRAPSRSLKMMSSTPSSKRSSSSNLPTLDSQNSSDNHSGHEVVKKRLQAMNNFLNAAEAAIWES